MLDSIDSDIKLSDQEDGYYIVSEHDSDSAESSDLQASPQTNSKSSAETEASDDETVELTDGPKYFYDQNRFK